LKNYIPNPKQLTGIMAKELNQLEATESNLNAEEEGEQMDGAEENNAAVEKKKSISTGSPKESKQKTSNSQEEVNPAENLIPTDQNEVADHEEPAPDVGVAKSPSTPHTDAGMEPETEGDAGSHSNTSINQYMADPIEAVFYDIYPTESTASIVPPDSGKLEHSYSFDALEHGDDSSESNKMEEEDLSDEETEEDRIQRELRKQQRQEMLQSTRSKELKPLNKFNQMLKTSMRFVPKHNTAPNIIGNAWDDPYLFKTPGMCISFEDSLLSIPETCRSSIIDVADLESEELIFLPISKSEGCATKKKKISAPHRFQLPQGIFKLGEESSKFVESHS